VTQFVRGLQGDHPRYVRTNAGCKHFAVYAGPEDIPSSRFSFNAKVSLIFFEKTHRLKTLSKNTRNSCDTTLIRYCVDVSKRQHNIELRLSGNVGYLC